MPPSESLKQPKYRILGLVGHGQFGQVFCAIHRQTGQMVALKNLERQRFPTHQFLRELRFLLSLQHQHIVSCYAIEHTQTGRYLVMDYCEGGTLRGLMEEENHLCLEQSLQVICDILQGLEHAHGRGIVHCDIKPENILLCLKPKGWIAKISDFGIARLSQELSKQSSGNTGSPAYMAPERFYGQYSPTSDLYSVGIMLFELLAGYRPFTGAPGALMGAHLNQHVRFSDAIPEVLQPIIQKSLQKLSARRFHSATEMLEALRHAANELNLSLDSNTFSLDKPLLESRVVPIACSFDASQCDRLLIAPVHLDAAQGNRSAPPCNTHHNGANGATTNSQMGTEHLSKRTSIDSNPDHDQRATNPGSIVFSSSRHLLREQHSQDMLVAYGAASQVGFQLRMAGVAPSAKQFSTGDWSTAAEATEPSSSMSMLQAAQVGEGVHSGHSLASEFGEEDPPASQSGQELENRKDDSISSLDDSCTDVSADSSTESVAEQDSQPILEDSEESHQEFVSESSMFHLPTARAIASQTLSTLSASVLFSQPIQGIAVRPQGCYVITQHTLHLLSNHQLRQAEPTAELIHQFEQDCTFALEKNGRWLATVTDMRQVLPKSGFSTLSFHPLPSDKRVPMLAQHPIRLALAGEASALLQAIALDSRHVAVVSDVPPLGSPNASGAKKPRSPRPYSGGTYLEVFTRRGQLIGALSLPILLGQVCSTPTSYRLLATDQYDLYSILQIDLKPFRIVRFAVQIVPQFLVASSWGYVVMNAQGHIILLDQQGYQVNRIEGPTNPTAIALIEPSVLLIATQDRDYGRLYTVDLKELGVDILF